MSRKLGYTINGVHVTRKTAWMPCIINERYDDMTPEEQVAIFKATWWADNLTNTEWPVMLQNVRNPSARSRLKRKLVGWFMILGRIAALNVDLYNQAVAEAQRLYHEQIGDCHPMFVRCPVCEPVADSPQPDDDEGGKS
jgi:hypothetical protein